MLLSCKNLIVVASLTRGTFKAKRQEVGQVAAYSNDANCTQRKNLKI